MAYEPKVWQCGEVVSADALNHLEQGVADASECCEGGGDSTPYAINRQTPINEWNNRDVLAGNGSWVWRFSENVDAEGEVYAWFYYIRHGDGETTIEWAVATVQSFTWGEEDYKKPIVLETAERYKIQTTNLSN